MPQQNNDEFIKKYGCPAYFICSESKIPYQCESPKFSYCEIFQKNKKKWEKNNKFIK